MANERRKIKKGNVTRSKTGDVNHQAARKALRKAKLLIQSVKERKTKLNASVKTTPAAKTIPSAKKASNMKRQGSKLLKGQQTTTIKKEKTNKPKSVQLRKTTDNILNKVNTKTKLQDQKIGKKITQKLEKQINKKIEIPQTNKTITDNTEETLEYAVPLNDYWNSLSFGTKSYDSLFSYQVDTPHIWADPTVWNIVYAAVPTEYSIPDQEFVNVLSQRIAWNLLQSTLPQENTPTFNSMMQALTNPPVHSYSESMPDNLTSSDFYESDSFELSPFDSGPDGSNISVSLDLPDPGDNLIDVTAETDVPADGHVIADTTFDVPDTVDTIDDTRNAINNGIGSPPDNLFEPTVQDSTNANSL